MYSKEMVELIKLGVDQVKKVPVTNFSQVSRNEAMRDKFLEIMGTEKFDVMAYNKHKHEIFEVIREVVSQTIGNGEGVMSSFYNQFVDESFIEWGDKKEYEVENEAYLMVGKVSGNNWDLDRQRVDRGIAFAIPTEAYYVKVYEYFKRFMTGRVNFEDLVAKVDASIKKFKDDFVADVLKKAVEGIPTGFKYNGTYDDKKIQAVLTNVSAANYGEDVVLAGTKGALNKLQGIEMASMSDEQKAEYHSNGYVRLWKGYICAEIPTVFKANSITEFAFDNDVIYVIPAGVKPIKVVNEGQPIVAETEEIADKKDMTKEFAVIFNLGGSFIFSRLIGSVEITN